jgi:hypothetical protein
MDPIMWDCQIAQCGGSLSSHQRSVLGDLYGGRAPMHRAIRRMEHRPEPQPHAVGLGHGLALVAILVLLPLVMSM